MAEAGMSRQIDEQPRNRRRIEPFETTLCKRIARCLLLAQRRGPGLSALTFAANIRKHPGLTLVMARAEKG